MEPFVRRVIRSSLLWLVIGVLIGAAMTFAPAAALAYRPAHAHANLLGFVSMMIFGVAYHVIPRFGAGTGVGDVPSAACHRDDASLHARVDHDLDPGRALPVPTGRAGRAHPIRVTRARDVLDRIVDLDARDDLQRGQEPFSWIMAARRDLRIDEQAENLIRVFVRRLMRSHTDSKERRIWSRRTPEHLSWTCG